MSGEVRCLPSLRESRVERGFELRIGLRAVDEGDDFHWCARCRGKADQHQRSTLDAELLHARDALPDRRRIPAALTAVHALLELLRVHTQHTGIGGEL